MARPFQQVTALLLFVACGFAVAADVPHGKYADQLRAECHQLMADAVTKPYGLAWGMTPAVDTKGTASRPVAMDPGQTPAAGVVLLWAGEFLQDASIRDASFRAAMGTVAAQAQNGQIAPIAMFGDAPSAKPDDRLLPDRASTRAGLALLLATLDSQMNHDEKLLASVDLASRWLRQQQAGGNGAWLRADPTSPDKKMIQLDDRDYRDTTFAMLLEEQVLDHPDARQSAERALNALLTLQLRDANEFSPGAMLWGTRYSATGDPIPLDNHPKQTADLISSRYAGQILLGAAICWGHRNSVTELDRTAERIKQLKRPEENWKRFEAVGSPVAVESAVNDFELPSLLSSSKSLKNLGPDRYRQLMSQGGNEKRQLAAAIVGLTDDPFTLNWPVARDEVAAYIKSHESEWLLLNGEVPQQLSERVNRLWVLLKRARLEQ